MHWPGSSKKASAITAAPADKKDDKKDDKKGSSDGFDGFNPDELERGAIALKEIDASKNSHLAFQLAEFQEKTAGLEHLKSLEEHKLYRAQAEAQASGVIGDESRKTISHYADQERDTARHKAEVEKSLEGNKIDIQRQQMQYQLDRENEQFAQHEQIRIQNEQQYEEVQRETIRLKSKVDQQAAIAGAQAAAKGAAQQERENIEVRLRELRATASEERRTRLEAVDSVMNGLSNGAQTLYEDPAKAAALVSGLTCLAIGVYTARTTTRVVATIVERNMGRPPLVRETSRWTWRPQLMKAWPWSKKEGGIMDRIVLEPELAERLAWSTNALVSAQANGTPFRHLMLHGSPGTGKTLFARTLARNCGLDYAIMSGGDVGPLGKEGPHEIHNLFNWAKGSKKGLILFVDEADAFLRRGRGGSEGNMSEDARNALSVFLHHTGTESNRVSVILATNVPSMLDRAVVDRIDEAFEFMNPALPQRKQMLDMFMEQYVFCPTKKGWQIKVEDIDDAFLDQVAKRTEGLSGRQIAKLVLAFQSAVFGSGQKVLTRGLAETVMEWRLANPEQK